MKAVRRASFTWFPLSFGVALWLGAWTGFLVEGAQNGAWVAALVLAVSLTAIWSVGWGNAVRYSDTHVSVTNGVITRRVAWQDVMRVRVGKHEGLVIWVRDGQELHSVQYGKSLMGDVLGYRTYQHAREVLETARQTAIAENLGARTNPVRVETTLWWRPPLIAALALATSFALALALSTTLN